MDNQESSSGFNQLDRKNSISIMMGIVVNINPSTGKATVKINDREIPDLMVMAQRAGAHGKSYWLPAEGEQVVVLSPFGNLTEGIIAGSIYYGQKDNEYATNLPTDLSSSIKKTFYPDGTTTSYDAQKHELLITFGEKEGSLKLSIGEIEISAIKNEQENYLQLKKGSAQIQIDAANNILIATDKNLEIVAENINLKAKKVDVIKK